MSFLYSSTPPLHTVIKMHLCFLILEMHHQHTSFWSENWLLPVDLLLLLTIEGALGSAPVKQDRSFLSNNWQLKPHRAVIQHWLCNTLSRLVSAGWPNFGSLLCTAFLSASSFYLLLELNKFFWNDNYRIAVFKLFVSLLTAEISKNYVFI